MALEVPRNFGNIWSTPENRPRGLRSLIRRCEPGLFLKREGFEIRILESEFFSFEICENWNFGFSRPSRQCGAECEKIALRKFY